MFLVVKMKYIMKDMYGVMVVDKEMSIIKTSIRRYIDVLCMRYGSTYIGRVSSMKYILKAKGTVPFYVNSNILLIPTKNIREMDVIFINYFQVLQVSAISKYQIKIIFIDFTEFIINVSMTKFHKRYLYAQQIMKHFS